jgi:hypothetical protein
MPRRVAVERESAEPGVSTPEGVLRPLNHGVLGLSVPFPFPFPGIFPMLILRGMVDEPPPPVPMEDASGGAEFWF